MILHIPIAANAFYEYLETFEDEEATLFFSLYSDLKNYDRSCNEAAGKEQ